MDALLIGLTTVCIILSIGCGTAVFHIVNAINDLRKDVEGLKSWITAGRD